jgi:uncharacterized protein
MPKPRPQPSRLDPRRPLVLDTRELGRRPGAMRRVRASVAAPPSLRTELVGVAEGAPLELELRLESVMEGVLVSGTVSAPLTGECGRCLDPVAGFLDVDVQQLFVYADASAPDDDDDELGVVEDDRLDLEPAVRDAIVLALPLSPHCREDCPGLCASCGARLADDPHHQHAEIDRRWSALAGLRHNETDRHQEN